MLSVTLARVDHGRVREIWLLQPTDGKTSLAPDGNKSLRLLRATHIKYEYLPTYLTNGTPQVKHPTVERDKNKLIVHGITERSETVIF